ncbi:MAG: 4'-phosphopantetheinyl transferase superfamily protein [Anaerolineales bacterium]|nr:MAG: 4'-phosphopantetheinyl transferase superfamily protein [Anaerolineales bacterium]
MYFIREGDIDLWRVDLDLLEHTPASLRARLSPEELIHASSFRHDRDKGRFLTHKSALREILGGYLGLEPEDVRFVRDRWGKPNVANPDTDALEFNTSHSGGISLIVVRRGGKVGVDIEKVIPDFPWREVAPKALNESEIRALELLPAEQKSDAFYAIWTRKEALAKAVGLGLRLDLPALQVPTDARLTDWSLSRARLQHGEVDCALVDLECCVGFRAALALVGSTAEAGNLICRAFAQVRY